MDNELFELIELDDDDNYNGEISSQAGGTKPSNGTNNNNNFIC